ncbi:MAG: pantoate--beta-alanine ligase [Flavobacteriales bacterium]|jgi:pantoate--beta-alanine ligase
MIVFTHPDEWSALRSSLFSTRQSVGCVATMGALHAGHQSLISRAAEENDLVVTSVYVNPTQFNVASDLEKYPRDLGKDLEIASAAGCEVVFAPTTEAMYGENVTSENTDYGILTSSLEGAKRPGHFNGVVTIVRKLLTTIGPDNAYFGEKDFQQLAIIRELAIRESLPVNIVGCELIRNSDGLAMSSRNVRLTPEGRIRALEIIRVLKEMEGLKKEMSPQALAEWGFYELERVRGLTPEYMEVVNSSNLESLRDWSAAPARILTVAWADGVRLLDNIAI